VQLAVSRKKALELSRDLVQAANTELPKVQRIATSHGHSPKSRRWRSGIRSSRASTRNHALAATGINPKIRRPPECKRSAVGRPGIVDAVLSCSQFELTNFLQAP